MPIGREVDNNEADQINEYVESCIRHLVETLGVTEPELVLSVQASGLIRGLHALGMAGATPDELQVIIDEINRGMALAKAVVEAGPTEGDLQ